MFPSGTVKLSLLLTCWAVVGSVVGQLGQALKVLLAVITREDGVVVQVVLMIPVVAVVVLLRLPVFVGRPRIVLGFSVRRRNIYTERGAAISIQTQT